METRVSVSLGMLAWRSRKLLKAVESVANGEPVSPTSGKP